MSDLSELIANVEGADERAQHRVIHDALVYAHREGFISDGPYDMARHFLMAGAYLDAARTLLPEGYDWDVGHIHANGHASAAVMWQALAGNRFHEFLEAGPETNVWWGEHGKAATPELALVAACLRAYEARR